MLTQPEPRGGSPLPQPHGSSPCPSLLPGPPPRVPLGTSCCSWRCSIAAGCRGGPGPCPPSILWGSWGRLWGGSCWQGRWEHPPEHPLEHPLPPDRPDPPGGQVLALHPQGPAGGAPHPAPAGPGARLRLLRAERQLGLHPDTAAGLLGACRGQGAGGRGQGLCSDSSVRVPEPLRPRRRRWRRSSSGRAPTRQPWARAREGHQGPCVTRIPGKRGFWGEVVAWKCAGCMVGAPWGRVSSLDASRSPLQGAGGSRAP